ncbi:hypothetical protein BDW59DRAFT_154091 [Aspergillus cavernicola]|uniref:Uncharacterized protein n=1 Tax=Aspergillus cavernicola TaxID=176166 RepID=A0ABR4HHL9_9EURO
MLITDSDNRSYTVKDMVDLSIRYGTKRRTYSTQVYIAESESKHVADHHDILLEKSWRTILVPNFLNESRTFSAAPTQLQKGKGKGW